MPTLDTIRRITIQAQTQGVAQATAQLNQFSAAQSATAASANQVNQASLSVARAVEQRKRQLDSSYSAMVRFNATQRDLDRGLQQSAISLQQHAHYTALNNQRLKEAGVANANFTNQNKLARYELINLSRQVQDVGVSLASGQSPFTVLVQQGTQIFDVFAASRATFRGFISQMMQVFTVTRLLAGGLVALGAAALASLAMWKNWALALDDAAKSAGFATEQFSRLQQVAAIKGISEAELASGMERFAQQVRDAQQGMGLLAEWFRANNIQIGDQQRALEQVADLLRGLPDDVARQNALMEMGLPATMQWVRLLQGGGKALREAMGEAKDMGSVLEGSMIDRARRFDEAWERAWNNFKMFARAAIFTVTNWLGDLIQKASDFGAKLLEKGGLSLRDQGINMLKQGAPTAQQLQNWSQLEEHIRGVNKQLVEIDENGNRARTSLTVNPRDQQHEWEMITRRVGALGDLATITDKANAAEAAARIARLQGVRLTEDEIMKIKELARARAESAQFQERAALGLITVEDALAEAERQLAIAIGTGNVKWEERHGVLGTLRVKMLEMVPGLQGIQSALEGFANNFVQAMARGESAVEALMGALGSLGSQLTSMGTRNIMGGLTAGFAAGAGGFGAAFAAAGGPIGIAMTAVGTLFSFISSQSEKRKREQEQQRQAAEAARKAWEDAQDEMKDFISVMSGNEPGSFASAISNATRQMREFSRTAEEAGITQARAMLERAKAMGIDTRLRSTNFGVFRGGQTFEQIEQLNKAEQAYQRGIDRMVEAALNGAQAFGEVGSQVQDTIDEYKGLAEALVDAGRSAEYAAYVADEGLRRALIRLGNTIRQDLLADINEALGKGHLNDFTRLIEKFNELTSNADKLGLSQDLINQWLQAMAQDLVNGLKLTEEQVQELIGLFPQLQGVITAFVNEAKRTAEELAEVTATLEDRLLAATTNASSMEGALILLERRQMREREAEIAAGGEMLALLEQVHAAERLQLIQEFVDRALEEERRLAEERARIFEDATRRLTDFAERIRQFVVGLRTGAGSPLSPQAQLQVAQTEFDRLMNLILTGTAEERIQAMQQITQATQTLLEAFKNFNPAAFPAFFENIIGQLETLPAQLTVEDLILEAIQETNINLDELQTTSEENLSLLEQQREVLNQMVQQSGEQIVIQGEISNRIELGLAVVASAVSGLKADLVNAINNVQAIMRDVSYYSYYINAHVYEQYRLALTVVDLLTRIADYTNVLANNSTTSLSSVGLTGRIVTRATGGFVFGPGTGRSDSVPARLSNGEFIVRADVAKQMPDFLNRLNAGIANPGNDNTAAEIRALRQEVAALRRVSAAGHGAVREGIDVLISSSAEALANEKLRTAR